MVKFLLFEIAVSLSTKNLRDTGNLSVFLSLTLRQNLSSPASLRNEHQELYSLIKNYKNYALRKEKIEYKKRLTIC